MAKRKTGRGMRILKAAALCVALAAAGYFAVCAYIAQDMTLAVRKPLQSTPADFGLAYEPVEFPSLVDNIPLRGWFIGAGSQLPADCTPSGQGGAATAQQTGCLPRAGGRQTILMLHAKDGKRDDPTIGLMEIARALVQHNYNVFVFDFRGHGESGGTRVGIASVEDRDVGGALAYLKARGISQVGALGFSMGAATALNSAAEYPALRVLVTESAFADFQQLLDYQLVKDTGLPTLFTPGIMFASLPLFGMDFGNDKPVRAIAQLGERPVLLIHGTADVDVPLSQAYELQAAGAGDTDLQLWIVPGAEHVRAFRTVPDEFLRRVIGFFDEYLH